jgi:hypothetical protein
MKRKWILFVTLLASAGCAAPFPPTPTVADSFVMYSNGRHAASVAARGANREWHGTGIFLPFNPYVFISTLKD